MTGVALPEVWARNCAHTSADRSSRRSAALRAWLPTLALPVTRTGGVHRVPAGLRVPRPAADTEPPADAAGADVHPQRTEPERPVHVVAGEQSETHHALLHHHSVGERMSDPSGSQTRSTTRHRSSRASGCARPAAPPAAAGLAGPGRRRPGAASRCAVGSSSSSIGAGLSRARARASRARSPAERRSPDSPIQPCGATEANTSPRPMSARAVATSVSVASGRASCRFPARLSPRICGCCGAHAQHERRSGRAPGDRCRRG
jgi:hypothetical protein